MSQQPPSVDLCRALTIVDGATEEVVDLHQIDSFDLEAFARQFDVPVQYDPQMLDRYAVGPDDVQFLTDALGVSLPFDFSRFAYFIEALKR